MPCFVILAEDDILMVMLCDGYFVSNAFVIWRTPRVGWDEASSGVVGFVDGGSDS